MHVDDAPVAVDSEHRVCNTGYRTRLACGWFSTVVAHERTYLMLAGRLIAITWCCVMLLVRRRREEELNQMTVCPYVHGVCVLHETYCIQDYRSCITSWCRLPRDIED